MQSVISKAATIIQAPFINNIESIVKARNSSNSVIVEKDQQRYFTAVNRGIEKGSDYRV